MSPHWVGGGVASFHGVMNKLVPQGYGGQEAGFDE